MPLSALDMVIAERDCARLVAEYVHHVDHDNAAEVADLFTPDGTWQMPGGERFHGTDELRRLFPVRMSSEDRVTLHVCAPSLITVHDEMTATGCTYFVNYRADGFSLPQIPLTDAPRYVGEYRDSFRRTADGWRIDTRTVVLCFAHARFARE